MTANNVNHFIEKFAQSKILCIGDLMLDKFVYGQVDRVSPEAPVPILHIQHKQSMLGGAGNVARNIVSLGAKAYFLSVVGDDEVGRKLEAILTQEPTIESYLTKEQQRKSTCKTRYLGGNQHLLRVDDETVSPICDLTEQRLIKQASELFPQVDVVILSDYAKGVLTDNVVRAIITGANKHNKPVLVDPKRKDFGVYRDATLIVPNLGELINTTRLQGSKVNDIVNAAQGLIKDCKFGSLLVTCGKDGMILINSAGQHESFPAHAREVYDVSGAGDTVVASLAVSMASGMPLSEAVFLANIAAGIVVTRIGTAQVHQTDLKTALVTEDLTSGTAKILPASTASDQIEQWRQQGDKIGFTNGCFDLIHPGHISLMDQAKSRCDKLIVGLNSDSSVARLKGPDRPIQNEMSRALVLASLEAVDMVVLFSEDTPEQLLKMFRPDLLVKGADYTKEQVVGGSFVESYGGKVYLAKLVDGKSTSNIVNRMAQ